MVTHLVVHPQFTIANQIGCCGIGTVARLRSGACSRSQRSANLASWLNSDDPKAIGSDLPNWNKQKMLAIMDGTRTRPQGVLWAGRMGSTQWYGNAVEPDLAYSIVLEAMKDTKFAIYFLSDNMDDQGDCHIGPFTTRGLVDWIRVAELGQIQATGPIKSLQTQRNIQGWMFTPNWEVCELRIISARAVLIDLYKGYNNDPKIKQAEQNRCKEQKQASRAFQESLSSGWSGRSFNRHYVTGTNA